MLPEKIRERIDFEFDEIESLFELYKEELFDGAQWIKFKSEVLESFR